MTKLVNKNHILFLSLSFLIIEFVHILTARGLFFDEGIYFMIGKLLVFRNENWNFETWVVGSPWAYPMLVGYVLKILSVFGYSGIEWTNISIYIVRGVNTLISLMTGALVFGTTKALYDDRKTAFNAMWLFLLSGCILFTSGFATYDIPALFLTALSLFILVSGVKYSNRQVGRILTALSGLVFAASFITKYITIVFVPILVGITFVSYWPDFKKGMWRSMLWTLSFLALAGNYVIENWWGLRLVFLYSGGHTANYGATPWAICAEILWFIGIPLFLGTLGVIKLKKQSFIGFVLLGGSLIIPTYHIIFSDPLALFKQASWSILFLSPIAGFSIKWLCDNYRKLLVIASTTFVILSLYQLNILRQFYPDPDPAITYLQKNVDPNDDYILVDDVWQYRWGLNTIFNNKEWWVVDQWWWENTLLNSNLLIEKIKNSTFSYIVFEKGGAFSGDFTIFDNSVVDTIENSNKYEVVFKYPSYVTWGNAILIPPFAGRLKANEIIWTYVYKRKG